MRRWIVAAAACCAAGAIAVSGCSSSVDGAARPGSIAATPGSAAPAGTVISGSRTTGSAAGAAPGSTGGSSPVDAGSSGTSGVGAAPPAPQTSETSGEPPAGQSPGGPADAGGSADPPAAAGLDEVSSQWFTTYCRGMSEIAQFNAVDTSGLALPELTAARVAAYSGISLTASTTVGILEATPPPTFAGGRALEASVVQRLSTFSDVYGRGALSLRASPPQTEAALQAAVSTIEQEAAASMPDSMATVDAGVLTAAKQLPECLAVLN